MGWNILVLIPKGNTDTWYIGILETIWKVMEAIIDNRLLASIQFHDALHGFRVGRGTGTATTKINISQELARVNQYPLFLVFLELMKAHNTEDRVRLIRTLEGYSAGQQMCDLLATFWVHQEVLIR